MTAYHPQPPDGWVALRVHNGDQKLLALGATGQVTHLLRDTGDGRSACRVTACGLFRFDTTVYGQSVKADLPGWGIGDSGVWGPNVTQERCEACWAAITVDHQVRGLTVRQPWASLIAMGVKTIETRSFSTRYRGRVLIHAAAARISRYDPKTYPVRVGDWSAWRRGRQCDDELLSHTDGWLDARDSNWRPMPYGQVVAVADLVDCLPIIPRTWPQTDPVPRPFLTVHSPEDHCYPRLLRFDQGVNYGQELNRELPYGDYTPGRFGWVLDNVRLVRAPLPAKGRLGLWKPSRQLVYDTCARLDTVDPVLAAAACNPATLTP